MDAVTLLQLAQSSVATRQWVPAGGQLVNSTSPVTLFSWGVAAGVPYQFRVSVFYTAGAASAGKPVLTMATANGAVVSWTGLNFTFGGGPSVTFQTVPATAIGSSQGPTMTASDTYVMTLEGMIEFSTGAAAGLLLEAACTVAADTWTIGQGSYMTLTAA